MGIGHLGSMHTYRRRCDAPSLNSRPSGNLHIVELSVRRSEVSIERHGGFATGA